MTPDRGPLLDRVLSFDIDGGPAALPFAARLAREHGWPRPYADRVIREYKRYAYLAATAADPVCPSEDVDAAWHLHLTYTRSYWKRFCGEVLGRPLHHDPTKGGPAEAGKHHRMYERTLADYRAVFGEDPPADVWPPAAERFGDDLRHRVVNTARHWVIPKRPVRRAAGFAAALALIAAFVPGCNGGLNPFELRGAEFLAFLIPAMIAAVCLGRVIRTVKRTPDVRPGDEDLTLTWDQAAFLSGGEARLTTAAIARLAELGALRADGENLRRGRFTPDDGFNRVEQAVLSHLPLTKANLHTVRDAVAAAYAPEAARLEAAGFTLGAGRRTGVGCAALLPLFLVVVAFGVPRLVLGVANHKPVGYLVVTLIFGGIVGACLAAAGSLRLSRRGQAALARLRERHARMKTGRVTDAALGVALFGTAVLAGSTIAYLQTWYPRQTTEGSLGGCGSGCGSGGGDGGGGCGGGCGGCGGGGD